MPYVFMNTDKHLCKIRKTTQAEDLETWDQYMNIVEKDGTTMKQKMALIYVELLQAVANADRRKIGELCEKNLYKEFDAALTWIGPQVKSIEVQNLPSEDNIGKLQKEEAEREDKSDMSSGDEEEEEEEKKDGKGKDTVKLSEAEMKKLK
jgi:DNA polymerase III gamma/tau subunit